MPNKQIVGKKGGKQDQPRSPNIEKNTLLSRAVAIITDVISEGPIRGLVNGLQSIYLDETPVQDARGSSNFDRVRFAGAFGLPTQDPINAGLAARYDEEVVVGVEVTRPVIREVTGTYDSLIVKIVIPSLFDGSGDNGDVLRTTVGVAFDIQREGQGWRTVISDKIYGKTTAAYEKQYVLTALKNEKVLIRARKTTPGSADDDKVKRGYTWQSYTRAISCLLYTSPSPRDS